ncbi:hypothetical protein JW968_03080 [Candidatus Woesearchaeota archaeon]|nr:hypothetical protein [Candidatus Woesearchaeota archaeon]
MRNITLKAYKNLGFGILTASLIIAIALTMLTYIYRDMTSANKVITSLLDNHLTILIIMIIISIAFGFFWAQISYAEISKTKKQTKTMMDIISIFLSEDEKVILGHLVENKGRSSQAEISRLPGMTRVKAYRLLQRMHEKNLIDIETHGKLRNIILHQNILYMLSEQQV